MATIEEFMKPSVSQWILMKPNPHKKFIEHTTTVAKEDDDILHLVFALSKDDTGNLFLEGFVRTAEPFEVEVLSSPFGDAAHSPCFEDECKNPTLTEILLKDSVREIGEVNPDFNEKKLEIEKFKQDADVTSTNMTRDIQRKHFNFFQCLPHLVISCLKNPSAAPQCGCPESLKQDANAAMFNAISTMAHKHPTLFRAHPKSVIRCLVSQCLNVNHHKNFDHDGFEGVVPRIRSA